MENINFLNSKNEAEVEIFFDEIEPEKECNYLILGALFINTKDKDKILRELLDFRCQNNKKRRWDSEFSDCKNKNNCKESWHKMNNTEIHFNEIRESRHNKSQINISKSWINFFINKNLVYINILYIDLTKLDTSFFGDKKVNANIYNKFFRTVINYGLKCFFSNYDRVKIKNIFYDKKGELERHYFFNNLNFDKVVYESKENIELLGRIIFIDSDHKLEKSYIQESQLIQLVDLILGTVRQNIFYISKDKVKNEISKILTKAMLDLKREYWSVKYLKISFFPKNKIISILDLNNDKTYEKNDEFLHLDSFELRMPTQSTNLSKWL
jgi:hypothetical protein